MLSLILASHSLSYSDPVVFVMLGGSMVSVGQDVSHVKAGTSQGEVFSKTPKAAISFVTALVSRSGQSWMGLIPTGRGLPKRSTGILSSMSTLLHSFMKYILTQYLPAGFTAGKPVDLSLG